MTDKPEHPSQGVRTGPRIVVVGVGGAGGNAIDNMIQAKLAGVEFLVANTDAQALGTSLSERRIQMGRDLTQGLGAGSRPDIGRAAAEEALSEILEGVAGANMVFITAGMGGGTGTGAAPVIAKAAREAGILTVGVVTKPFHFEGTRRMSLAEAGIEEMAEHVDTLIIIPNQNLFRVANEKTTFADAFKMADDVLRSGVRGITDLMVTPGLINLDFADVRSVMTEMGKAIMGSGEAEGDTRALSAAEAAISNPLLEEVSMKGARGVLINITGGMDLTLFEIDQAANRIRDEVDPDANIIFGSTFDAGLEGRMRVSVVAAGIDVDADTARKGTESKRSIVSLYSERIEAQGRDKTAGSKGVEDAGAARVPEGQAEPEGAGGTPDMTPDKAQGKTPGKTSAPVFPFRARSRDRKAAEPFAAQERSVTPHPATGQSGGFHPITRQSLAADEREPAAHPDDTADTPSGLSAADPAATTAGGKAGADPSEAAAKPVPADAERDTDAPTKPELVLSERPNTAAEASTEHEERLGSQLGSHAVEGAVGADEEPRRKKPSGFFSWISGGGGAEDLFKKADRLYHGQGVRKDLELAFGTYLKAAEAGHPGAQNRVGWMYEKGEGVEADHGEAVRWYRRAAEQGYVNAMNDLGYMHRQGWGVPQSHEEALYWFGRAAAKYDSYAEYNMGQMYENGWGVEKDMDEAVRWFRRSAARGHEWAAKRLEELGVKT